MICPCCGTEIRPRRRLEALVKRLSPQLQGPVMQALVDARCPLSTDQLVRIVYGGRPDGGPLAADKLIHITISRLRPKVEALGYRIIHEGWSGYSIHPIETLKR